MGQPKRAAVAMKKTYNTRASKRSRSPEDQNRVSKVPAKKSTPIKENGATVTRLKFKVHKASREQSIDDDIDSSDDENISKIDFSSLVADYVGPLDDESAKERMGDALFMWNWRLLGDCAKDSSSNIVSLIDPVPSHSPSSPSIESPILNNAAIASEESEELPSKRVGSDENNPEVLDNEDEELERPGNNEIAHSPSSSTSSLSSIDSSEVKGPQNPQSKTQKAAPKTGKKASAAASAAASKLPRGKACTRCKSRKLKCGIGATCPPCARAGVACSRPQ